MRTINATHTRKASGVRSEGSRYRPSKNICLFVASRHILWHDRALGPPCQCIQNTRTFILHIYYCTALAGWWRWALVSPHRVAPSDIL